MANLSYRASLKNTHVEEVIDLLIHRPLGYVVARAAYPTPITPDALTIVSMLLGVLAGAALYASAFASASLQLYAGALLIASAVVDCSDGQLARMRQRSSRFGRMLDGTVDAIVQVAAVPAAGVHMVHRMGGLSNPTAALWAALGVLALIAGIRHTTLYDQFKNVYVRNTERAPKDCDDAEDVDAEWRCAETNGAIGPWARFNFYMYRTHLRLVAGTMRWIDPGIPARFREMPPYAPARAALYHRLNGRLMRAWSFFGIGTHIFTFAICVMLGREEWYIVLRLVGFNALLLVLVPFQRRASRAFFAQARAHSTEPMEQAA